MPTSPHKEWVGFYKNMEDALPQWIVHVGYLKEFTLDLLSLVPSVWALSRIYNGITMFEPHQD